MAKLQELPMPFSVAVFECSDKKLNKQRILKTKLIISLVFTIFGIGFLVICVCGTTINWAEDRVTLNIGSDMERSNSRPDNGKPPLNAPLNGNCTSFADEKLTKLTNNQNE